MVIHAPKKHKSNYWKVQESIAKLSGAFDKRRGTKNPMPLEEYREKYHALQKKIRT